MNNLDIDRYHIIKLFIIFPKYELSYIDINIISHNHNNNINSFISILLLYIQRILLI
jgi:hypothetical protein